MVPEYQRQKDLERETRTSSFRFDEGNHTELYEEILRSSRSEYS